MIPLISNSGKYKLLYVDRKQNSEYEGQKSMERREMRKKKNCRGVIIHVHYLDHSVDCMYASAYPKTCKAVQLSIHSTLHVNYIPKKLLKQEM